MWFLERFALQKPHRREQHHHHHHHHQVSGISLSAKNKRPAIALNNSITSTPVKPSAKQVKVNDETESDLKKIYDLIALMNSKLDKLDQIEIHLARVDQDIKDLKHSYTFVNETADELKRNQITQDNAIIKSLEESITTIKGQNLQLHQEVIDVRAHSMRSNLVFYNHSTRCTHQQNGNR